MKEAFERKTFTDATLETIVYARRIVAEYMDQGYTLTLRQLYYQMVARGIIPNKDTEYRRLGRIVGDARLTGLLDWDAIEDRTRTSRRNSHWDDPVEIVQATAEQYTIDRWEFQPYRVEVYVEKDALLQVVGAVCSEMDVTYLSTRGYPSLSELYEAGNRLAGYVNGGQEPIVLHLSDHDPSGVDMTRDLRERLSMFAREQIEVKRIALTMDQIRLYNPPPNPAKITDSRADDYIARYGRQSWELDALEPAVLRALIEDHITEWRDDDAWNDAIAREKTGRKILKQATEFTEWTVAEYVGKGEL